MIVYRGTILFILSKILKKEFEQKYNWTIIYRSKTIELYPSKPFAECFLFNTVSYNQVGLFYSTNDGSRKHMKLYIDEVIPIIYKWFFQKRIIHYISNLNFQMYSLYTLSFFQLTSLDIQNTLNIFE